MVSTYSIHHAILGSIRSLLPMSAEHFEYGMSMLKLYGGCSVREGVLNEGLMHFGYVY